MEKLIIAKKALLLQNEENQKLVAALIIANKELVFQNEEKEKRAAELVIANKELAFQNEEKEKRAAELIVYEIEIRQVFQNLITKQDTRKRIFNLKFNSLPEKRKMKH